MAIFVGASAKYSQPNKTPVITVAIPAADNTTDFLVEQIRANSHAAKIAKGHAKISTHRMSCIIAATTARTMAATIAMQPQKNVLCKAGCSQPNSIKTLPRHHIPRAAVSECLELGRSGVTLRPRWRLRHNNR